MHREYKIAIIGFGGAIAAAIIGLISFGKSPNPELIDATPHLLRFAHNMQSLSVVDLKLKNSGDDSSYVKRIEVKVLNSEKLKIPPPTCQTGCHITDFSEVYSVDLTSIKTGDSGLLNVSHTIDPNKTDRIGLAIGAEEPTVAKIQITILADDKERLTSPPMDLLVINHGIAKFEKSKEMASPSETSADIQEILTDEQIKDQLKSFKLAAPKWLGS